MDHSEDIDGPFVDTNDRPIAAVDEVSIGHPKVGGFHNDRTSKRESLEGDDLALQCRNERGCGSIAVATDRGIDGLDVAFGPARDLNAIFFWHA